MGSDNEEGVRMNPRDTKNVLYILMDGNQAIGYHMVGPFLTEEDASTFCYENSLYMDVISLVNPHEWTKEVERE